MGHMTGGSLFWSHGASPRGTEIQLQASQGPWPISGSQHPFRMVHAGINSGPCETHAHVSALSHPPQPPSTFPSPHAAWLVQKRSPRGPSMPTPKKKSSQRNVMQWCVYLPELG